MWSIDVLTTVPADLDTSEFPPLAVVMCIGSMNFTSLNRFMSLNMCLTAAVSSMNSTSSDLFPFIETEYALENEVMSVFILGAVEDDAWIAVWLAYALDM